MEKVVIFGGSGFIGKHLVKELINDYEIVLISRRKHTTQKKFGKKVHVERYRRSDISKIVKASEGAKAVINLAGENVGTRWSRSKMDEIKNSRLDTDSLVIRVIRSMDKKPELLLQGSSIGVYGYSRVTEDLTEESANGQRGFLPKIAISHEEAVEQLGSILRIVYLRTGMVLGNDGGALPKMVRQFNMYLGGKLGSGSQWISWIHVKDEVRAIRFLLELQNSSGPYNLTAPNPVTNRDMTKSLAKTLDKPAFVTAPGFILRIMLGAMADELLLSGVKVLPKKLLDEGFKFNHSDIDQALENLYNNINAL